MSTTTPPTAMPDGEHAIDLPNPLDPEAPWVTYGTYRTWADALRVARHMFGADDLGRISLITTLPVDDESEALPTETPRLPVYRDRARRGVLERTIVRRDRLLALLRCSAAPQTAADIVVALRRCAEEGDYNYSLAVKDLNALEAAELARFVGHPRRWSATSQQPVTAADAAAWS